MRRYPSAATFHQALEERLKKRPGTHQSKRDLLAIERLLYRLLAANDEVVVKGGIALKLRTSKARTTSDLDLRLRGDRTAHEALFRAALGVDAGDFMTYEFAWSKNLEFVAGHRFRVRCSIGGRQFSAFDVDFAPPEPILGDIEELPGADWLAFCAIPTPTFKVYPLATQLAEKVHALTVPRRFENTRVKDLPDVVLIATMLNGAIRSDLRDALRVTFEHRRTHPMPNMLSAPSETWRVPYEKLAALSSLPWTSLDHAFRLAAAFIDPVLGHDGDARWDVDGWTWRDTLRDG